MKRIVSCSRMKSIDAYTISEMGVPSMVLMERAALAVVSEIEKEHKTDKILVVCGSGNNGGDGIAIARILHLHGFDVEIYLAGNMDKMTEETHLQYKIAKNYGVSFVNNIRWCEYTTIVDAIFGVGLAREIQGKYKDLIEEMNRASGWKVAVDIPSGIHGDTGCILGTAFRADATVTFAYRKAGLCLYPGRMYAGRVSVAGIGIYAEDEEECRKNTDAFHLELSDLTLLPERIAYGNKGTFGKVLIVAGSRGMCGAAYLSAAAAMAGGCGMVKIVTAEDNRIPLQTALPEAMISCDFSEWESRKNMDWCDVLVVGPGVGTSDESAEHVQWFLNYAKQTEKLTVLDADGLNLFAANPQWKEFLPDKLIITPHLGEMSRLTGKKISEIQKDLISSAANCAKELHAVCVLKDACTVIADENGNVYLNLYGNAGMATAGSGDVLAGLTAAVCCMFAAGEKQLNVTDDSDKIPDRNLCLQAAYAVMIHGRSGDLAAASKGMHSMKARDIIENIGKVLQGKEENYERI